MSFDELNEKLRKLDTVDEWPRIITHAKPPVVPIDRFLGLRNASPREPEAKPAPSPMSEQEKILERRRLIAQAKAERQRREFEENRQREEAMRLADAQRDEENRMETVRDMMSHPRQRRFMERVMPIEWCH